MENNPSISVFDNAEQLAIAAAERFVEEASRSNRFSVALAGGRTPKRVYELLASDQFKNQIGWSRIHLFFGDERCVPPNHADSNYRMVYDALISRVKIPTGNIRRIPGEGEPVESAVAYENELHGFFPGLAWPRFDLVFLGMGDDGHTASLFPNSESLEETSRWVVATRAEQPPHDRITLTLPVFNHAAHVIFLVQGKEKAQRLAEVLRHAQTPLPVQLIKPFEGRLEWLIDRAAASCL